MSWAYGDRWHRYRNRFEPYSGGLDPDYNYNRRIVMNFSMQDGRVFGIIGGVSFPLTTLPLEQWTDGQDAINHPALKAWERDCNQKFVKEGE